MRVLDRGLVYPFDTFWAEFGSEAGVAASLIEEGSAEVFGHEYQSSGSLPSWMELPDGALSYHVAHELAHRVLRKGGFPSSLRGPQYVQGSAEARVGGDLEEMVTHHALEELLKHLPFDRSHIREHLFSGALRGLENSPVPETSSLWWVTWACRYCELRFLLQERQWLRLEVVYEGRCSDIAEKGRELADIMDQEGFQTPAMALRAMVRVRDALETRTETPC